MKWIRVRYGHGQRGMSMVTVGSFSTTLRFAKSDFLLVIVIISHPLSISGPRGFNHQSEVEVGFLQFAASLSGSRIIPWPLVHGDHNSSVLHPGRLLGDILPPWPLSYLHSH